MAYSEAINYTEDQQILNAIVRDRYGQTFTLLAVSSVTANVKVRATAASELQAWESDANTDALIPLSFGFGYEENPTISYVPLQGEDVLRRLTSQISVEEGFLTLEFAKERNIVSRYIYQRINNFVLPDDGDLTPKLARIQSLENMLLEDGIQRFGRLAETDNGRQEYVLILSGYAEEHLADVREYLDLLGVNAGDADGRTIAIPFGLDTDQHSADSIRVATRSVYAWLRLAGRMIDIPEDHISAGIVEPAAWSGPESKRLITIRSSRQPPEDAVVSVPFRGWWFYIDSTDSRSKESFRVIKLLVTIRLNTEGKQQTPVLTVPVG